MSIIKRLYAKYEKDESRLKGDNKKVYEILSNFGVNTKGNPKKQTPVVDRYGFKY
jgi:hypothetical protein